MFSKPGFRKSSFKSLSILTSPSMYLYQEICVNKIVINQLVTFQFTNCLQNLLHLSLEVFLQLYRICENLKSKLAIIIEQLVVCFRFLEPLWFAKLVLCSCSIEEKEKIGNQIFQNLNINSFNVLVHIFFIILAFIDV